jgi:hypothetical protein
MKTYRMTVKRMQEWHFDVHAEDYESAQDIADEMADSEGFAHDDYAYSTEGRRIDGHAKENAVS